jgi:hypothetical protein
LATLNKNKQGQYLVTIVTKKLSRYKITPLTSTENIEYLGYHIDPYNKEYKCYYYAN